MFEHPPEIVVKHRMFMTPTSKKESSLTRADSAEQLLGSSVVVGALKVLERELRTVVHSPGSVGRFGQDALEVPQTASGWEPGVLHEGFHSLHHRAVVAGVRLEGRVRVALVPAQPVNHSVVLSSSHRVL